MAQKNKIIVKDPLSVFNSWSVMFPAIVGIVIATLIWAYLIVLYGLDTCLIQLEYLATHQPYEKFILSGVVGHAILLIGLLWSMYRMFSQCAKYLYLLWRHG